ncbi:MBL fold metallo-hydrolase [Paenibacillus sp. NPDC056722]|uniref:MBL fold metallo-hydrolase n=1 Tax=Paenibacillus sp. NPDC056722 TaxID=3345924 RepID=UPI00367A1304
MNREFHIMMLGVGNGFVKSTYHNNALLEVEGRRFLIDCGALAWHSLYELGLGFEDIDGIFITHLHYDHCGGLDEAALYGAYAAGRKMKLWLPAPLQHMLWEQHLRGTLENTAEGKTSLADYFDIQTVEEEELFWLTASSGAGVAGVVGEVSDGSSASSAGDADAGADAGADGTGGASATNATNGAGATSATSATSATNATNGAGVVNRAGNADGSFGAAADHPLLSMYWIQTHHVPSKFSCSLVINNRFFYSADMVADADLVSRLHEEGITDFYHDCSFDSSPVHASFQDLCQYPEAIRQHTYLMHYGEAPGVLGEEALCGMRLLKQHEWHLWRRGSKLEETTRE